MLHEEEIKNHWKIHKKKFQTFSARHLFVQSAYFCSCSNSNESKSSRGEWVGEQLSRQPEILQKFFHSSHHRLFCFFSLSSFSKTSKTIETQCLKLGKNVSDLRSRKYSIVININKKLPCLIQHHLPQPQPHREQRERMSDRRHETDEKWPENFFHLISPSSPTITQNDSISSYFTQATVKLPSRCRQLRNEIEWWWK